MFGNLLGDMEERQKALKEQLAQVMVNGEAADGMIKIEANATREITNISIDPEFLKDADAEELEDLLLVAINRTLSKAAETEAAETQKLIQDMLPPGMGNMFGM